MLLAPVVKLRQDRPNGNATPVCLQDEVAGGRGLGGKAGALGLVGGGSLLGPGWG
jgi:hypothetical protein